MNDCCAVHSDRIAKISATILEHTKTPKVIAFKKKRRKNYKRTKGMHSIVDEKMCNLICYIYIAIIRTWY